MSKNTTKRGRGRPTFIESNPKAAKAIAKLFKTKQGELPPTLDEVREVLATEGISYQPKAGQPKVTEQIDISKPTLAKLAKELGAVTRKRGRPAA